MREELLGSHDYVQTLKGQKLRFPNLDAVFSKWPKGMNPHYEELRNLQDAELAKCVPLFTLNLPVIYSRKTKHSR